MTPFLLVGAGGFLGAIARYGIYLLTRSHFTGTLPIGTFLINISGCFLAGLASVWIERVSPFDRSLTLLCTMGFLGSYTTFSALEMEAFTMMREGQAGLAVLNFVLQITLGLGAVWLGHTVAAR